MVLVHGVQIWLRQQGEAAANCISNWIKEAFHAALEFWRLGTPSAVMPGVTDVGMVALGSGPPSLQVLDVSNCRKLTDKGLVAVAKGCCNPKSLHLAALVDGCRHTKFLDVNKCSKIEDIGVSSIVSCCSSSLRTLKLLDCYDVGDESILSLADSCKNLKTLIVGGCRNFSDESMKVLAIARSDTLRHLRLDWCSNISHASVSCILSGIGLLLKFCKSLQNLDVSSCPNITKTVCEQVGGDGANVMMIHQVPPQGYVSMPVKQLVRFSRVFLPAGKSKTVPYYLNICKSLNVVTGSDYTVVPYGQHTITVGDGDGSVSFPFEVVVAALFW
ncbi:hypothetical protein ACLOJK_039732 [Asimina triloba]